MSVKVSATIVAYNNYKDIKEAIVSMEENTSPELEKKIYIVDNDELERQLADAVSLVRNGNKLHISSLK